LLILLAPSLVQVQGRHGDGAALSRKRVPQLACGGLIAR
jgi:hypothetical protein